MVTKHIFMLSLLFLSVPLNLSAQTSDMPLVDGTYSPTWTSVSQWTCPEWFKDAKFGMWARGVPSVKLRMATGMRALCITPTPNSGTGRPVISAHPQKA